MKRLSNWKNKAGFNFYSGYKWGSKTELQLRDVELCACAHLYVSPVICIDAWINTEQ